MTEAEMAEVEGEGPLGAILGAGVGCCAGIIVASVVSVCEKISKGHTNLDKNLSFFGGALGTAGAAVGLCCPGI